MLVDMPVRVNPEFPSTLNMLYFSGMKDVELSCRHYLVRGRVQGVFFRASAADEARSLNLLGWVRNLPDGRVEAQACGSPQAIADFTEWLRQGPPAARVEQVETRNLPPDDNLPRPFEIRR